jgi:hypothetical protein
MKWKWASSVAALSLGAVFCGAAPRLVVAQDQVPQLQDPPAQAPQEPTSRWLWPRLKEGKLSLNFPFRFEGFERDGAPFTAPAYARTLRLALGYETPAYHGFSVFGQGEAAVVTGPADYSVPLPLSQNRPNLPIILDPKSMELSQG